MRWVRRNRLAVAGAGGEDTAGDGGWSSASHEKPDRADSHRWAEVVRVAAGDV